MNRAFAGIILCFILLNGFTSCKLLRHPAGKRVNKDTLSISHAFIGPLNEGMELRPAKKDTVAVPVMSNEKKMLIERIKPVWQEGYNFTSFSGKAKMHYEEKDNQKDFTAHIRVKKDSVIWIYITALGGMVQVAKVYINQDSLKMINYFDKEVLLMPLSQATRLLPVPADFATLQNFIVGQALRQSGWISDAADSGNNWYIVAEDSNYVQHLVYNKTDSTLRSGLMLTHAANSPEGLIQYNSYGPVQNKKFSFQRIVHIENAGAVYELDMDFTNVDFDQELDYSFSIPKSYTVNPRK
jgi:hypothetical protein